MSYPGHTWGTHGRLLEMTRCVRQWGFPLVPFRRPAGAERAGRGVGRAVDAPPRGLGSPGCRPPDRSRAPRHLQLLWDARTARPVYPWWRWRSTMAATSSADAIMHVKAAGTFTRGCGGWLRCLPFPRDRRGGPHHLRRGTGPGTWCGPCPAIARVGKLCHPLPSPRRSFTGGLP